MRLFSSAAALLAAYASAQSNAGCTESNGNWYCNAVNAITYQGVGGSGSYNRVNSMNSDTSSCGSQPYGYSGSIAPLNEEVSWHFRGPLILSQFAAYTPGKATTRKVKRGEHARHHAHGVQHRAHRIQERQVGATVTATIDGVVDTWINTYSGGSGAQRADNDPASPSSGLTDSSTTQAAAATDPAPSTGATDSMTSATSSASTESPAPDNNEPTGSGWGRNGYYNADSQCAEGIVFLNHAGGQGSGVFDYTFGSSLSYASADGATGASSNQTLQKTTLASSTEVLIMSDQQCSGGSCGFTRPGTVAYHGFDGRQKAFFFEFQMPNDGTAAQNIYDPANMPAIWMLNAQIPRTLQYGNAECSCWTSGCGELDIFEVLSPGDQRAKSTLHGNIAGGDSNYFQRPENSSIKLAVVMYNDNVHIKLLDDGQDFPSTMDSSVINQIVGSTSQQSEYVSLFNLAGAGSG